MLIGDKNAIMVASRILGYGKEYEFTYDGKEQSVDLSTLEPVDLDFSQFTKGQNEFSFELPTSKRPITFKLLTGGDERSIADEIKAREKVSKEHLTELQKLVNIINGIQFNIGKMETQKHAMLHEFAVAQDKVALMQDTLNKEYGTYDVNLADGSINWPKDEK